MTSSAADKPNTDNLIPDCCNIGVVCRVLLFVNGCALAAALVHTAYLRAGLEDFVASSVVLEPACLASLLVLCALRPLLVGAPAWVQRACCALVPGAVTAGVVMLLTAGPALYGFGISPAGGAALAVLQGILLQHYFELRTRVFSPAVSEARLQALQARIRPHFLFNSLNAVLSLIRSEPRRAESALEDLAELFRVLMRDARDLTTLADEIRLCRQYLSIEKIRLGERLQVEWDTEEVPEQVLREARVPALLLQPLVENAVHYGVEPARDPVPIRIVVTRVQDRIEIAVINPIPVLMTGDKAPMPGSNMALANIRERLALLHDVEAKLTITDARGFFEVHLRFPFVKAGGR